MVDTDQDGMADFWEKTAGSSPVVDDAMSKAPDGYPLIEHYLNWLAELHALRQRAPVWRWISRAWRMASAM